VTVEVAAAAGVEGAAVKATVSISRATRHPWDALPLALSQGERGRGWGCGAKRVSARPRG
jgi:hypothetical protein